MAVLSNGIKIECMNILGNEVESCSCGLKVGGVDFERVPIIVISEIGCPGPHPKCHRILCRCYPNSKNIKLYNSLGLYRRHMLTRTMIPREIASSHMVRACPDGRHKNGDGDDPFPQTRTDPKARQRTEVESALE